jgi:hypothetical protein
MIDIVIDLETLGTKPGCPIIEIGACAMDSDSGKIVGNFSRRISHRLPKGYFDLVLSVGRSSMGDDVFKTIKWWNDRADRAETFRRITFGGVNRNWGLQTFCAWFRHQVEEHEPENVRVWANGPSFDISILCGAFDLYGITRPWFCWQERCVRTALELCSYEKGGLPWSENGPRHRALNDARHEAKKLWHCGALGTTSMVTRRLRELNTGKPSTPGEQR